MSYSRREQAYKYHVISYDFSYWAAMHIHNWLWLWTRLDWWHMEPFGICIKLYLVVTQLGAFVGYAYLEGNELLYIETHDTADGAGTCMLLFLQERYNELYVRNTESTNTLIRFYSNMSFSVIGGPRTGVYDWYWKRRRVLR